MKRAICSVILIALLFCGCAAEGDAAVQSETEYTTGVWFSYLELDKMLSGDFQTEFATAIENCKTIGITDVFVHIRPFCDSLFNSEYFPLRETARGLSFDAMEFMVSIAKQNNMRFHAWINPYRVSRETDINALPNNSPAYKWLNDEDAENDCNVLFCDGIYLNPAAPAVQRLVIDGVREILEDYDVDGIHFDDYFYPTADAEFDRKTYEKYCADTENTLGLADWRRANVNALISGTYTAVKFYSKDKLFSISPAASLQNNYDNLFADVKAWIESDCVDIIIPQIYFGFDYPIDEYRFNNLVEEWKELLNIGNARLMIGLAAYKIGTESEPDRNEWNDNPTLLKRQSDVCLKDSDISGHIYYSYSAIFSDAPQNKAALREIMNTK